MAKATTKAASLTTLVIGKVEVAVGLFSSVEKPGRLAEFTTAGPNGGVLKAQAIARAVPVNEQVEEIADVPVHSNDPLADDPEPMAGQLTEEMMVDSIEHMRWPTDTEGNPLDPLGRSEGRGHEVHDAIAGSGLLPPDPDAERLPEPIREVVDRAAAATVAAEAEQGFTRLEAARDPVVSDPDPTRGQVVVDGEYGRELVEEGTGQVVKPEDIRRGIRLDDGRFIDCTDQIAAIVEETELDRMQVVRFVDISQVHRARMKATYYVGVGDEKADTALRLLYEAMKRTRRAAVVKLTKKSRQSLGVIGWLGDTLVLYELVWAEDFREAPARAKRIQKAAVNDARIEQMCKLIDAMSGPVTVLDELRDDAIAKREELYAKALAGEVPDVVIPPAPEPAVDVMAMLEASLAAVA